MNANEKACFMLRIACFTGSILLTLILIGSNAGPGSGIAVAIAFLSATITAVCLVTTKLNLQRKIEDFHLLSYLIGNPNHAVPWQHMEYTLCIVLFSWQFIGVLLNWFLLSVSIQSTFSSAVATLLSFGLMVLYIGLGLLVIRNGGNLEEESAAIFPPNAQSTTYQQF